MRDLHSFPTRRSSDLTGPGPFKPPRETGGAGRVVPHRVPDQRVLPVSCREHAVAVAVPTTGERGRLSLAPIPPELLEEQSDRELGQIFLVPRGTVATCEIEARRVEWYAVASGM